MPGAGKLRERITFQERAVDANDDAMGDWQDRITVWAQLVWLRGGEGVLQQRMSGRQPVAIVIRDSTQSRPITTAWRAVNARRPEQVFNITAVAPSKDPGFLDVLGVMGGATG